MKCTEFHPFLSQKAGGRIVFGGGKPTKNNSPKEGELNSGKKEMVMKIEHVGYMVQDPIRVAEWYCANLGFKVVRGMQTTPFTHFLADNSGNVMVEIYNNPAAQVPDYASMDPLVLHLAFDTVGEAIETVRDRLINAGATLYSDLVLTPAGDQLIMLRDPWGMAVQLAKRKQPMIK